MRANEPYVDDAIRVVDPHRDAILVAGDIEHHAAVLEDAGRPNFAFDARRGLKGRACERIQILALFLLTLSQAYPRPTAVLVYELDAGVFNCAADFLPRILPTAKFPFSGFEPGDRGL
jgi:hypothetical protein